RLVGPGHPALADAGALDDPRVGGVEAGLEIGVGQPPLGKGDAPAGDGGCPRSHRHSALSQATGSPSRRRSPGVASMPMRNPVKRLHTGVRVPQDSTTPTAWPSVTISPSAVTVSGGKGWKMPAAGDRIRRSGTTRCSPTGGALCISAPLP